MSERLIQKRRGWQALARHSPGLFLASPHSLLKKTSLKTPLFQLREGDPLPDMPSLGYRRKDFAENPGDFSRRGFICDVFSPAYSTALRLELTGDRIVSLHLLDAGGKKRKETLTSALLPLTEEGPPRGELQKLCRFLKKEGCGREALQSLARGKIPFGFEILRNALDNTCSLDWFARPPWIWIYEPESLKQAFADREEGFSRLPPPFRFQNVYLPWTRLQKERLIYLHRGRVNPSPFSPPSASRKVWNYPCRKIQKPLETFLQKTGPSVLIWVRPQSPKGSEKNFLKQELASSFTDKEKVSEGHDFVVGQKESASSFTETEVSRQGAGFPKKIQNLNRMEKNLRPQYPEHKHISGF